MIMYSTRRKDGKIKKRQKIDFMKKIEKTFINVYYNFNVAKAVLD